MKRFALYFKIFSFVPILNLILLLSLIMRVYISTGMLPKYAVPDPKILGLHYQLYFVSEILMLIGLVVWPILLFISFSRITKKTMYVSVFFASLILLFSIFRIPDLGLGEWIVD